MMDDDMVRAAYVDALTSADVDALYATHHIHECRLRIGGFFKSFFPPVLFSFSPC